MAKKKKKFYVVWAGHKPGVYATWADCQAQTKGFSGAEFKSFESLKEAQEAFEGSYEDSLSKGNTKTKKAKQSSLGIHPDPILESYAVDAACAGNPGVLEYQCVHTDTKETIFKQGPFEEGTNNIGEFLAIVHALALCKQKNLNYPIYTDSKIAMGWVKRKKCNTKLAKKPANAKLYNLIERAETWLKENEFENQILKWETKVWGEIPADFGRK